MQYQRGYVVLMLLFTWLSWGEGDKRVEVVGFNNQEACTLKPGTNRNAH